MIKICLVFLFAYSCYALNEASIIKLKGSAFKITTNGQTFLKQGDNLNVGELVVVSAKSFLKIEFTDKTKISLSQGSTFKVEKFDVNDKGKNAIFKLLDGKLRAEVTKSVDGREVDFNTKTVSFGVRGTEFLMNAYSVKGNPVTDNLLLEGSLEGSSGVSKFSMKEGQLYNSSKFKSAGKLDTVSNATRNKLLANKDKFLDNVQLPDGSFKDIDKELSKSNELPKKPSTSVPKLTTPSLPIVLPVAGVGVGLSLGGDKTVVKEEEKEEEKEQKPQDQSQREVASKEKQAPKSSVKIMEDPNAWMAKLPSDIRDAYEKREDMKMQNQCFYFIYKTLPGSFNLERFRRTRDCDEYEYNL